MIIGSPGNNLMAKKTIRVIIKRQNNASNNRRIMYAVIVKLLKMIS